MRASQIALHESLTATPARIEAAYSDRAARLAKERHTTKPASPAIPAVIFSVGKERYAIELKALSEILALVRCTPVPEYPPEVLGVINLRGEIRAVLDASCLLGLGKSESPRSGFVLMLRQQLVEIGLKVDGIEELREFRAEELSHSGQGKYMKGLLSGAVMLLDTERMLAGVLSQEEA